MDLFVYWRVVRRWWWIPLLGVVLAMGASVALSAVTTPTYRSTTRILVNQVQSPGVAGYQDILVSQLLAQTYSELLRGRPLAEATINRLNLPLTPTQLVGQISVRVIRDTQLLEVSIDDTDPARAAVIANGLVQVFIERTDALQVGQTQAARDQVNQEIVDIRQKIADTNARLTQARATNGGDTSTILQLQGELSQYQDSYLKLLETQQRMSLLQPQGLSGVSVAEPASTAVKVGPRRTQNALLAGFAGLLLGIGIVVLIAYLDDRIHDSEEIRAIFNVPALATVRYTKPERMAGGNTGVLMDPTLAKGTQLNEAMRLLRANIGFLTMGDAAALCISSALPSEGKSTITANLAIAEAQAGKRVIVVDCDLRKPGLHPIYGMRNDQGLSSYLAQTTKSLEPAFQEGPAGVKVLTAGPVPPNPTELLGSQRMADLIGQLRTQADIVLLDSAPILSLADTLILQAHVDGTILVVNVQSTGTRMLKRIFSALEQASGRVLGVVLNKDRTRSRAYEYGYGYGYDDAGRRPGTGKGPSGGGGGSLPTVVPAGRRTGELES